MVEKIAKFFLAQPQVQGAKVGKRARMAYVTPTTSTGRLDDYILLYMLAIRAVQRAFLVYGRSMSLSAVQRESIRIFDPPVHRGLTHLDRSLFRREIPLLAVRLPAQGVGEFRDEPSTKRCV